MSDERKTKPVAGEATVVSGVVGPRVEVARQLGGRVGAVVLERQIGEGGMGVVWLGRHEILGREVAVKFLTEAVEEGDPGFAAFVEGARAAAAVKHDGLVQVHDAGVISLARERGGMERRDGLEEERKERGGELDAAGAKHSLPPAPSFREGEQEKRWHVPYLVMELVDGPGLDSVLRVYGALSLGVVLAVMEGVCSAIGELHAAGFVHRDIKPGNILLDGDGRVHVTDFGLACERPSHRPLKAADGGTGALSVSGTPAYMAPETFVGEVSARSDVYALAVMMYELLVGEPPFSGDVLALKRAHEGAEVPRAGLLAKGVPGAVIEVIERGMNKAAMLRPRSAVHLLESLRTASRERGVWESGARELRGLVARARGEAKERGAERDSTSYYKTIAERAEGKRRGESGALGGFGSLPPAPSLREGESEGRVVAIGVKCVGCGYALKGLKENGACPECGVAVLQSVKAKPLPCVGCGYDLIGIAEKCPECGKPVKESVWSSRLLFADVDWLKRVATGMGLMAWGLGLLPVLMLVIALIGLFVLGRTPARSLGMAMGVASGVGLITAVVLLIIGLLNATVREPGRHGHAAARWLRWAWLSGLALVLASMAVEYAEPKFPEQVLLLPGVHLLLIGVVLLGVMVERLGERIPDRKLMRAGWSVFWPWVLIVVTWLGIALSGWFSAASSFKGPQLLPTAAALGMLYGVVLTSMARRRLLAVAKIASPRAEGNGTAPMERSGSGWRAPTWMWTGVAVLAFAVSVVPLFLLMPYVRLGTYMLAERLGVLDAPAGMPGYTEIVAGREFRGRPTQALAATMTTFMVVGCYGVPLALGMGVYLWKMRARRDGVTRCGWCGYGLAGLREARCPECGIEIGGKPVEGGNPQAWTRWRWWSAVGVRMGAAGAVFPMILGLLYSSVIRPMRIAPMQANVEGVSVILLTHVPTFVVTLIVFHVLVRGVAGLRGRTWCGECGAQVKGGVCGCGAGAVNDGPNQEQPTV